VENKNGLFQTSLLFVVIFLLAACQTWGTTKQNTGTSASITPILSLGSQACPASVQTPTYWDSIIPTQPNVSMVESVTCAYLKGTPDLQALITVRYASTGRVLDAYVYDNLTAANPTQIFKLPNLYEGEAKLSNYNTIITSEVDQNSSANANLPNAEQVPDLFREFKWSDGAGTLVQIAFPGIFPDLTRYQAESDQQQVKQGYQTWKLSATAIAQAFGASLLHWNPNATLISGGGSHDAQAVVSLQNTTATSNILQISMSHLEGNTNGGIWIITAITTNGLSITAPQTADLIHSPVTVTGTSNALAGTIGPLTILDHLYTPLGHTTTQSLTTNGPTAFSTSIIYKPTFQSGAEEGLVMLSERNKAGGPTTGVVIVKVLIQ
jgi:hypothetical protein